MTTALAIRPAEQALEFRRCTGHCCDPLKLPHGPMYYQVQGMAETAMGHDGDCAWVAANTRYIGEFPPGGGLHLYHCRHFDREAKRCTVYGTGERCDMCRRHPEYGDGPWSACGEPGCTRRTIVLGMDSYPLRWHFPDMWADDLARWTAWERDRCRPEWGPECMPEGADE